MNIQEAESKLFIGQAQDLKLFKSKDFKENEDFSVLSYKKTKINLQNVKFDPVVYSSLKGILHKCALSL